MPEMIQKQIPISDSLKKNEQYMKDRVGLGVSFDLGVRKIHVLKKELNIYYVNGLCDTRFIIAILTELMRANDFEKQTSKLYEIVENRLVNQSLKPIQYMDELTDQVLSGLIVVLMEGETTGFVIDVRSYPGRQPQEPDTEKVIRGSRDGFIENIIINTALTRRRIRDERLRFEILKIGERSKTDVAIGYLKDVANPDLVDILKKELESIEIDGVPMADKAIEEFLVRQGINPYPLVRYTERADIAATHLLEGHVIIYVDTSPSVIITPTTFFHHLQHAEEYRQSPTVGTFIRWVRFIGTLASLFLLPLWLLVVLEPSLLPKKIAFIGPNKTTHIPVIIQMFLADFGNLILRMAAIHTPTALSTAMGLIAAVLIGQIAIDVGLFVPEVILYISIATIGTYSTPSYELGIANTLARLMLLIFVSVFHTIGFIVGVTLFLLFLVSIHSLNTPYLWPFFPFNPHAFLHVAFRRSVLSSKLRPSIVHPLDRYRQPTN
ncbi:spore germination protein [Cytobacillus sp. Hz8]|uniref:spore germination protein n=1 Tax=Cytobacillus sp. Hz8 TaxID=3347168 RepID=UPI0035E2D79B